jgi:hypothetical protein
MIVSGCSDVLANSATYDGDIKADVVQLSWCPLEFDGDRVHLVDGVAKLLGHCVVLLDHALADVNTNKLGRMGRKTSGYQTWKHSVIVVTHNNSMP